MFANDECGSFVLSCLTNDHGDMASIFTTNYYFWPPLSFTAAQNGNE